MPASSGLPKDLLGLKVLVVDDDEDTLDYFATALEVCGAEVRTASNAADALRLVEAERPNAIVSDIAMVGHAGYWLVREVHRLPADDVRAIPVLATTAYGREHSRARAIAAGFVDHLQKPVDPRLLCDAVARVAGR